MPPAKSKPKKPLEPVPATDSHGVAGRLMASYEKPLPINHLRSSELPSRDQTIQLLKRMKDVLFPDHRLGGTLRQRDFESEIGALLAGIESSLERQIYLSRSYASAEETKAADFSAQAKSDTRVVMEKFPELREILSDDIQAAYDGDPAASGYDEIIYCYPGFEAVSTYRIAHELHLLGVPLLPRIMSEYAHSLTGCDIHPGATIGRSFFIDHATGVVIGATAVIGNRVKLYQGVTLGALSFHHDDSGKVIRSTKRHPTLEDDVVIYAGATVLGGATVIGQGSVIGGSCWITHSMPPHTKVILSEPQMRVQNGRGTPSAPQEYNGDWSI